MEPTIIKSAESYASSFQKAVDTVARERKYLATVQGHSLESARAFLSWIAQADLAQYFLTSESEVVGWCDIIPHSVPEFAHVGLLGMGLLPAWRGQGWGRKLLARTLEHAATINKLEKVELVVFESNEKAQTLYRSFGFVEEGRKIKARKIDGHYENEVLMATFLA